MDHIVPLIRGGKTTRGNVVPACKECNNKKKYLLLYRGRRPEPVKKFE
jgi:5-methylcytosine-specific restriction endonuclease McrA